MKEIIFLSVLIPLFALYHCLLPETIMVLRLFFKRRKLTETGNWVWAQEGKVVVQEDRSNKGYMFAFTLGAIFYILVFHGFAYLFYSFYGLVISLAYPVIIASIIFSISPESVEKVEDINLTIFTFKPAKITLKNKLTEKLVFGNEKIIYFALGISAILLFGAIVVVGE